MDKRLIKIDKLVDDVLIVESRREAGESALSFMARAMVQATMPHSCPKDSFFERVNGNFTLTMVSHPKVGLPYGTLPRLLIAWITEEACRTKSRELVLGTSLSEFMRKLNIVPTGGRWGTITRLKEQMKRLFSCSISCTYDDGNSFSLQSINPVSKAMIWWNPTNPEQATLWESKVVLSEDFFNEITNKPVPIEMDILCALRSSSLAIDIYIWLKYRFFYLKRTTEIPWSALRMQFGSGFADTKQGRYSFKRKFIQQMAKVVALNPSFQVEEGKTGLVLKQKAIRKKTSTVA